MPTPFLIKHQLQERPESNTPLLFLPYERDGFISAAFLLLCAIGWLGVPRLSDTLRETNFKNLVSMKLLITISTLSPPPLSFSPFFFYKTKHGISPRVTTL